MSFNPLSFFITEEGIYNYIVSNLASTGQILFVDSDAELEDVQISNYYAYEGSAIYIT